MTTKDYDIIAKGMFEVIQNHSDANPFTWLGTVNSLVRELKKQNPKFDGNKFRNDCGWVLCTGYEAQ